MKLASLGFGCTLCVVFVGLLNAAQQAPAALTQTEVLRQDLSIEGREVVQILNVLPPGGASGGKHTHPGEEVVYVLEGSIRFEIDGQAPVVKNAGEAIVMPAGRPHSGANAGTGTARAIVNYIVEKGKPRTTFVK